MSEGASLMPPVEDVDGGVPSDQDEALGYEDFLMEPYDLTGDNMIDSPLLQQLTFMTSEEFRSLTVPVGVKAYARKLTKKRALRESIEENGIGRFDQYTVWPILKEVDDLLDEYKSLKCDGANFEGLVLTHQSYLSMHRKYCEAYFKYSGLMSEFHEFKAEHKKRIMIISKASEDYEVLRPMMEKVERDFPQKAFEDYCVQEEVYEAEVYAFQYELIKYKRELERLLHQLMAKLRHIEMISLAWLNSHPFEETGDVLLLTKALSLMLTRADAEYQQIVRVLLNNKLDIWVAKDGLKRRLIDFDEDQVPTRFAQATEVCDRRMDGHGENETVPSIHEGVNFEKLVKNTTGTSRVQVEDVHYLWDKLVAQKNFAIHKSDNPIYQGQIDFRTKVSSMYSKVMWTAEGRALLRKLVGTKEFESFYDDSGSSSDESDFEDSTSTRLSNEGRESVAEVDDRSITESLNIPEPWKTIGQSEVAYLQDRELRPAWEGSMYKAMVDKVSLSEDGVEAPHQKNKYEPGKLNLDVGPSNLTHELHFPYSSFEGRSSGKHSRTVALKFDGDETYGSNLCPVVVGPKRPYQVYPPFIHFAFVLDKAVAALKGNFSLMDQEFKSLLFENRLRAQIGLHSRHFATGMDDPVKSSNLDMNVFYWEVPKHDQYSIYTAVAGPEARKMAEDDYETLFLDSRVQGGVTSEAFGASVITGKKQSDRFDRRYQQYQKRLERVRNREGFVSIRPQELEPGQTEGDISFTTSFGLTSELEQSRLRRLETRAEKLKSKAKGGDKESKRRSSFSGFADVYEEGSGARRRNSGSEAEMTSYLSGLGGQMDRRGATIEKMKLRKDEAAENIRKLDEEIKAAKARNEQIEREYKEAESQFAEHEGAIRDLSRRLFEDQLAKNKKQIDYYKKQKERGERFVQQELGRHRIEEMLDDTELL
ncbi:hypothetical protein AUTU_46490 (plasmid) [Aureibacter tunicatorum]|nr:hypothetical protein AUTU_46490 [Aureibacter tunicatorum]